MSRRTTNASKGGSRNAGFTLVEVLVSCALFIIIMTLLMTAVNYTSRLVSEATAQIEVTRIGREAFDVMGRDLASATLPWSRTSTTSLQFLTNPAPAGLPAQYLNHDSIFWQAPIVQSTTGSNLAVIGYFVQQDTTSSPHRFQLRRVYIQQQSSGGVVNPNYLIYTTPNAWITSTLCAAYAPTTASADASAAEQGWLADGVLEMWIQCEDKFGVQIPLASGSFNSRVGYTGSANISYSNFSALPAFVQVVLVCIAPPDVPRLTTLPAPPASGSQAATYVASVRSQNPGVKSVTAFTRTFRILGGG